MTKFGTSVSWDCESEFPQACDYPHLPTVIANQITKGLGRTEVIHW